MKKILLSLFIAGFLILSCEKQPEFCPPTPPGPADIASLINQGILVKPDTFCMTEPFPEQPNIGFTSVYDSIVYRLKGVNPLNPYEMAYSKIHVAGLGNWAELWTINLSTGEQSLLLQNDVPSLDWGKNGWLVFHQYDDAAGFNIYKIKANGDSMTRLTQPGNKNIRPQWNAEETRVYYEGSLVPGIAGYLSVLANGDSVQPVYLGSVGSPYIGPPYWSPDDSCAIIRKGPARDEGTWVINANTGDSKQVTPGTLTGAGNFKWVEDSKSFFWSNAYGVYQTDVESAQTDTILQKSECNHLYIYEFGLPVNDSWLFVNEISKTPIGMARLAVDFAIYLYDLKTGEKWLVNLD